MNWYEHHIKDYATATDHLSWDQDMAYTRLIRRYYRTEAPIDADVAEACRKIRATSKVQREAVASVLKEFFELRADGWHQDTCDEAIARYRAGEPEREAKKKNEDTRLTRHRTERATLFAAINEAGHHLPYNAPIAEVRALAERIQNARKEPAETAGSTATATPLETGPATPATHSQRLPSTHPPPTTHHSPELNTVTPAAPSSTVGQSDPKPPAPPPPAPQPLLPALPPASFLDLDSPGDPPPPAPPPAPKPPGKAKAKAKPDEPPPPTNAAWAAYSAAYELAYRTAPVRNGKVNALLKQLVDRLGAEEAPSVAAFFLSNQNLLYVRAMHPVDLLLRDCESLRTQWKTGRMNAQREGETPYQRSRREQLEEATGGRISAHSTRPGEIVDVEAKAQTTTPRRLG